MGPAPGPGTRSVATGRMRRSLAPVKAAPEKTGKARFGSFPSLALLTAFVLWLPLFFNGAFGQNGPVTRLDGSKISPAQIDEAVAALMDTARIQGMDLAILNHNRPVFLKSYGFKNKPQHEGLDTGTVMYAASFSKAVFAFVSMKLVEEGVLALDTPLYKYLKKPLPDYNRYASLKGDDRWQLMTARMCLSHTTGFPNLIQIHPTTGAFDTAGTLKIYFAPGSRYAYSGEGLRLLQLAEEELTGKGLQQLAEEKLFVPAGMAKTAYVWKAEWESNYAIGQLIDGRLKPKKKYAVPDAPGSLFTTISDFARFIAYVMQGKGLSATYREQMFTPQIRIRSRYQFPTITDETTTENDAVNLSYGLGWGLLHCGYGRAFFKEGHDDVWRNYTVSFYDKGTSIIIMTNSENGEAIFKELLEKLIGDTCTPWKWEGYTPYNEVKR